MNFIPEHCYHVYNRGNNKQPIFFTRENYLFFLHKIRKEILPHADVLAYCLMPNHFHLILYTGPTANSGPTGINLSRKIGTLLSSYSQAINKQENRIGSLFQQKTKAKLLVDHKGNLTTSYLATCIHYIHQNPLKSGLATNMKDWEFSSYPDYAGLRNGTLCNKELAFALSGINPINFIKESHEPIGRISVGPL